MCNITISYLRVAECIKISFAFYRLKANKEVPVPSQESESRQCVRVINYLSVFTILQLDSRIVLTVRHFFFNLIYIVSIDTKRRI
jgi:hypothetical protein